MCVFVKVFVFVVVCVYVCVWLMRYMAAVARDDEVPRCIPAQDTLS